MAAKRWRVLLVSLAWVSCSHRPPGAPLPAPRTLEEHLLARRASAALDPSSTITVMSPGHTAPWVLDELRGFAELPGDPCSTESCPAEGAVLVGSRPSPDGGSGADSFSINFSGAWLQRDGSLVVPPGAEGGLCGSRFGAGGGRCWVLAAEHPLTGRVDLEGRRFELVGELTNRDVKVSFAIAGAITNRPPTAQVPPDFRVPCEDASGATVVLDGSASSDPEGQLFFGGWRALAGPLSGPGAAAPIGNLVAKVHAPPGAHVFRLSVMDNRMQTATATLNVTVGPEGCAAHLR